MRKLGTKTFQSRKSQANIERIVQALRRPMTANRAADMLCMTHGTVAGYLSYLQCDPPRIRIVGNEKRAPVYQSINAASPK